MSRSSEKRSKGPAGKITFEVLEGPKLSDSDIDKLAQVAARMIYKQLKQGESSTTDGGKDGDINKES